MENFINSITGALPNIVVGILILILAFILASLAKKFVKGLIEKSALKDKLAGADRDPAEANKMIDLLGNLAFLFVFCFSYLQYLQS